MIDQTVNNCRNWSFFIDKCYTLCNAMYNVIDTRKRFNLTLHTSNSQFTSWKKRSPKTEASKNYSWRSELCCCCYVSGHWLSDWSNQSNAVWSYCFCNYFIWNQLCLMTNELHLETNFNFINKIVHLLFYC